MTKSTQAFRTIREVADWLGVAAHVLRFWESKFPQIKPVKRAGGRRYYRPSDMALVGGIKVLLHDEGMTIRGVQKLIRRDGVDAIAALAPSMDSLATASDEGRTDAADWLHDAEVEAVPGTPDGASTPDATPEPVVPPALTPRAEPEQAALPLDVAGKPAQRSAPPVPDPASRANERPDTDVDADDAPAREGSVPTDLPDVPLDRLGVLARDPLALPPALRAKLRAACPAIAALRDRLRVEHAS